MLKKIKDLLYKAIYPPYADDRLEVYFATQWKPILGGTVLAFIYCAVFYPKFNNDPYYLYFPYAYLVLSLLREICAYLYRHRRSLFDGFKWNLIFTIGMFSHGILWSHFGFRSISRGDMEIEAATTTLLTGVLSSNIISYPTNLLSSYVYVPMIIIPMALGLYVNPYVDQPLLAKLIILVYAPVVLLVAFNSYKMVTRLLADSANKGRMEAELKTAQAVQNILFPQASNQFGRVQISGYYQPATECGGDWWSYSQVGSKIYLWIGDATGHGASAALLTSAARSSCSIIEELNLGTKESMSLLNKSIYTVSRGEMMMTFFLACIDTETLVMEYCNASHEPPILVKKKVGAYQTEDIHFLDDLVSSRLGQDPLTNYKLGRLQLEEGDTLLFYTDGLKDTFNSKLKSWGERNFILSFADSTLIRKDATQIRDGIISGLERHRQRHPLDDDVTFFVCRIS